MDEVVYSLVVPFKDEEDSIPFVLPELIDVMQSLDRPWELICINDGSKDFTKSLLKRYSNECAHVRVLNFVQNAGQSAAFDAGFKAARGTWIITMDGDGQNDPSDIPRLLALKEQFDLICGWRVNRKDTLGKRCISKCSNAIRSRLCKDGVHDTGCSLKLFRTSALRSIKLYRGMHRFFPALFRIEGFTVHEIAVNHRPRSKGKSHYNFFNRSIGPFLDLFAVFWMRRRHLTYMIETDE